MTAYLLTDHILNFIAPAVVMALLLVLFSCVFGRFLISKKPIVQSIWSQAAIVFIVNVIILAAGLVFFGNDGKVATYVAMVLASALCQWVLARGWRA